MKVLLMSLLLLLSSKAFAIEYPQGWPWHGLSMDDLSSVPSDLVRYKESLNINVVRLQMKPRKISKRYHLTEQHFISRGQPA